MALPKGGNKPWIMIREAIRIRQGSWVLERENDRPEGHFLLIWRKIEGKWKIVVDHTSLKASLTS